MKQGMLLSCHQMSEVRAKTLCDLLEVQDRKGKPWQLSGPVSKAFTQVSSPDLLGDEGILRLTDEEIDPLGVVVQYVKGHIASKWHG